MNFTNMCRLHTETESQKKQHHQTTSSLYKTCHTIQQRTCCSFYSNSSQVLKKSEWLLQNRVLPLSSLMMKINPRLQCNPCKASRSLLKTQWPSVMPKSKRKRSLGFSKLCCDGWLFDLIACVVCKEFWQF